MAQDLELRTLIRVRFNVCLHRRQGVSDERLRKGAKRGGQGIALAVCTGSEKEARDSRQILFYIPVSGLDPA